MSNVHPIGQRLDAGIVLAGQVAAAADVPFADLVLYEQAEKALADASTLLAGIVELRERLSSGHLGSDARYDLGLDLYNLSSKVQTFTLGVFK